MLVENALVVLQPLTCKKALGKLHAKRYLKTREYTYFFREQNEHVFLTYHEQKQAIWLSSPLHTMIMFTKVASNSIGSRLSFRRTWFKTPRGWISMYFMTGNEKPWYSRAVLVEFSSQEPQLSNSLKMWWIKLHSKWAKRKICNVN